MAEPFGQGVALNFGTGDPTPGLRRAGPWVGTVLATAAVAAAALTTAADAAPAMPSGVAVAAAAALRATFADLAAGYQPGCAAAAIRDGRVLASAGFGYADLAGRVPVTPDTVFNVASISKQFTAFAVLLLEKRGRVSLGDSIRRYVPELGEHAQSVTLRHLLHHTGGLRDYITLAAWDGVGTADPLDASGALAILARQRAPDFAPGSAHAYSNTGYFLLSQLVEAASGRSMRAFAADEIFRPIGMASTSIVDRYPAAVAALARGYSRDGKGGFGVDESPWEMTGDGQVHTTVGDLALWDDNLRTGRVGGRDLVDRLTEPGTLDDGTPLDYANGLFVAPYRGLPAQAHGGAWAGYAGYWLRLPEQRLAVAVLCNRSDVDVEGRAAQIADALLGDLSAAKPGSGGPAVGADVDIAAVRPGLYRSDFGQVARLRRDGVATVIEAYGSEARVDALGGGYSAEFGGTRVRLAFPAADRIALGGHPSAYARIAEWTPPSDLSGYAGVYRSEEAMTDLSLSSHAGGGGLVATFAGISAPLRPAGVDEFEFPGLGLVSVATRGEVVLRTLGVRALSFQRSR